MVCSCDVHLKEALTALNFKQVYNGKQWVTLHNNNKELKVVAPVSSGPEMLRWCYTKTGYIHFLQILNTC